MTKCLSGGKTEGMKVKKKRKKRERSETHQGLEESFFAEQNCDNGGFSATCRSCTMTQ